MRRVVSLGTLALVVALLTACDTEQPLQGGSEGFEVEVVASGAVIQTYNVWNVARDNPTPGEPFGDQIPDDVDGDGEPDIWLWCEGPVDDPANPGSASSVPWLFGFEAEILHRGETEPERITMPAAIDPASLLNIARYDNASPTCVPPSGGTNLCPGNRPDSVTTVPGTSDRVRCDGMPTDCTVNNGDEYIFRDPRRLTRASIALITAQANPIGPGLCPGPLPGLPVDENGRPLALIEGDEQPWEVQLEAGDTITITVLRDSTPPPGLQVFTEPTVIALPSLGGRTIDVQGDRLASPGDPGFSFTFTLH